MWATQCNPRTSGVRVCRRIGPHESHLSRNTLCTSRFCATRDADGLHVAHDLGPDEICDDLAELLATELDDTGVLADQTEFEAVFIGVVQSSVADTGGDAQDAWLRFYRNSVNRLEQGVAAFAPVHEHGASLVVGRSVLDLGSCFGFFPLRLSAAGLSVMATDLSAPTMDLLTGMSRRLRRPLTTLGCDAASVPLPDRCADTVTVLHLIEHLDQVTGAGVVAEALRLARRRVVVAVPFEVEPRSCYGHVTRFDRDGLHRLGTEFAGARVRFGVHEFHGGWLVFDR